MVIPMATEPLNILLVDDEPAILRTLSCCLSLEGYPCVSETDPAAALARIRDGETFHILITDLMMPGMDGLDFIRAARDAGSLAQVLVVTAYSPLDRAVEAYVLGVADYLLKPFESLAAVVGVVKAAEARYRRWQSALSRTLDAGEGP